MKIRKEKIYFNNIMDLFNNGNCFMFDCVKIYLERGKAPIHVNSKQNKIQKLTNYKNI